MQINIKSATPVYQQIVHGMQAAVASGVYQTGEPVPSTRDLAIRLKVNPNTVQKAYEELVDSGILQSRRGQGKIVAAQGQRMANQHSERSVSQLMTQAIRMGKEAGMNDRRLRELLGDALKQASKKARAS